MYIFTIQTIDNKYYYHYIKTTKPALVADNIITKVSFILLDKNGELLGLINGRHVISVVWKEIIEEELGIEDE